MTEKEKMLAGKIYDPSEPELVGLRQKAHRLCLEYNQLPETDKKRDELMRELGVAGGENAYFQGPVQFDYGCFTTVGEGFYANFNFTCVDCCPVTIGEGSVIGAGSVVTRDIPPHSLAAGVPCRVIREITEADSLENHPELF